MTTERLLICGPRDLHIPNYVLRTEMRKLMDSKPCVLVNGCAKGVDTSANHWGLTEGLRVDEYPVTPDDWKSKGRSAGPIRNKRMLMEGKPTLVVAVWNRKTNGTSNMLRQAMDAGVRTETIEVNDDGHPERWSE
jgi:hypothetical protein